MEQFIGHVKKVIESNNSGILIDPNKKSGKESVDLGRRGVLKGIGAAATGVAIEASGLGRKVEAKTEQEKIHDELVDNKTIFKTKEDIKRAFEKYNTFDRNGQMDLNALNYYVPKYVGEQNPNIRNLSPSLVKLKVQMKYGQENYKTVEVPLIEGESVYEVKSDLIVRAQIVGGEGWVVLPKGTSIIMKNGKMDKIGVCRNDIHEVMCQAVRCNFEKGGKKISVMRMIGDGDNQEAVCREYLSQNRESIFKALTQ
jgi:hypothetical protein